MQSWECDRCMTALEDSLYLMSTLLFVSFVTVFLLENVELKDLRLDNAPKKHDFFVVASIIKEMEFRSARRG